MSALTGTDLQSDYIKVGDWYLPLPPAPAGAPPEWGILHFSPLEPYSPSTVLGDDSLVSDDRIAAMIWSNMQSGMGVHRYDEGQSLSGYADGDLDTTMPTVLATLPPQKVALGNLDAPFAAAAPVYVEAINAATPTLVAWNRSANGIRYYNGTVWSTPAPAGGLATSVANGFARFAGLYIVATNNGLFTSPDGATWTQRWNPAGGTRGLCVHDNKLYTLSYADNKLYWAATAAQITAGTAWPASSTSPVNLDPGEYISQMLEWTDKTGDNQVYLVTDRRIMVYDDADFFTQFWPKQSGGGMRSGGWPWAHVWARDDRMYLTFFPYNDNIATFDHNTIDDVGPNKQGGITVEQKFSISHLSGALRFLYGFCPNRSGQTRAGRTMKATEAFGWTTLNRGKLADPEDYASAVTAMVTGGGYADDYAVTVFHTGAVERQWTPDRGDLQFNITDQTYEQGYLWLYSGEADAALEEVDKLAKWWRIDCELPNGQPGIPPGAALKFKYRFDGGPWAYVPLSNAVTTHPVGLLLMQSLDPSAQPWPAVFPLPSRDNQQGMAFLKVEWAIGLQRAAVGTTPIVRSVSLHYTRNPDIYDGLQVPLDLSINRFAGDSPETQTFMGKTRTDLFAIIQRLKGGPGKPKRNYPVEIGRGGTKLVYASMDVRVSGNVDPSDNLGRIDLTLRDTSAPPSGLRVT